MLKLIFLLSITIIFGDPQTLKSKEGKTLFVNKEDLIDDPQVRGNTLIQKLDISVKQSTSNNKIGIQSKDDVKMKEKNVKDQMSKKLMGYSPRFHGYDLNNRHSLYWLWWWTKYTQDQESENKNRVECECGLVNRKTNGRIINGEDAEKNEYPWIVPLGTASNPYHPEYFESFCGGTIISSKTVLTAGHCMRTAREKLQKGLLFVATGEHNRFKMDPGQRFVKVCTITMHPKYIYPFVNDYAILTLCEELKWSKKVSPVCLPDISGRGAKYENKKAIVAGWGRLNGSFPSASKVLQEAVLTTMPNEYCQPFFSEKVTEREICGRNLNQGSCMGDSGGPLVFQEDDTKAFTIIGIVSAGSKKCTLGSPTIFARVTKELNWIKSNIQGSRCV